MATRHKSSTPGRGLRVADQIQRELAELIQREVKDPRVGLVTITGVDLTPDYAVATCWFTCLPDDEASVASTLAGLRKAAVFLRGRVGRAVRIHTTPELRFQHDPSTERGMAMSKLIDEAIARDASADDGAHDRVPGDDAGDVTARGRRDGEPDEPEDATK